MLLGESNAALKALELLDNHLASFTDRLEVNPVEGLGDKIAEAQKRLADANDATYQKRPSESDIAEARKRLADSREPPVVN